MGQRRAAAPGEQAEDLVQPGGDLVEREHARARRGQLDRQGDAIQPLADARHKGGIALSQRKPG